MCNCSKFGLFNMYFKIKYDKIDLNLLYLLNKLNMELNELPNCLNNYMFKT